MFHKHNFTYPSGKEQEPLTISGYGLTEYELLFCIECGRIIWKITKDVENLYPKLKHK